MSKAQTATSPSREGEPTGTHHVTAQSRARLVFSSSPALGSSHDHYFDYSATVILYVRVPPAVSQAVSYRKAGMESLSSGTILVLAVHTRARQVPTSLHKC